MRSTVDRDFYTDKAAWAVFRRVVSVPRIIPFVESLLKTARTMFVPESLVDKENLIVDVCRLNSVQSRSKPDAMLWAEFWGSDEEDRMIRIDLATRRKLVSFTRDFQSDSG